MDGASHPFCLPDARKTREKRAGRAYMGRNDCITIRSYL